MTPAGRIPSIDALRGLVMIVMALDHTREFFHSGAMAGVNPEDLTKTTAALFFTRWITHLCAPTFFFTAGLGAYFWLKPGRTKAQLSKYLVQRGLWLIFLELVVLRFIIFFRLDGGPILLTILWALGLAMLCLAALIHIPIKFLTPISLAVIALHNLADPIRLTGPAQILHQLGFFQIGGIGVVSVYPLVPWFAVMAIGYCAGRIIDNRDQIIQIGATVTIGFLAIRALNIYGEPNPWDGTFLSFLRCTKYPPSLDYLLMTLGPALLFLAIFHHRRIPILELYGRAPLFYFLTHFLVIHLLTYPFAWLKYGTIGFLANLSPAFGGNANLYPANYGYSLLQTYLIWIAVVVIMYPLTLWFVRLKERRRDWWLSYL
ncbi:MAG: DUF1624 domain-containing protein [Bryobacteraceae bacterium]